MTVIKNTDVIIPELLAKAVAGGFAGGKSVLMGTGAVVLSLTNPYGSSMVGGSVTVPYFGSVGEMTDITTDGTALTPVAFSETSETATLLHSGLAFEITRLAQGGASDPYAELGRQIAESAFRKFDAKAIAAAASTTSWSSYTHDISASSPGTVDYDALVDSLTLLGDEAGDWAAFVCHSKVYGDLLKLKDSAGNPILVNLQDPKEPMLSPLGVPIVVSDKLVPAASKYTSLLLKKNSLAVWGNPNMPVMSDKDILSDTDISYIATVDWPGRPSLVSCCSSRTEVYHGYWAFEKASERERGCGEIEGKKA